MNKAILNDRLVALISRFANMAMETRQVARRLSTLLPERYRELRREHAKRSNGAKADRLALTDPRHIKNVEEYAAMQAEAIKARVEYETHAMLYKARQSTRTNKR